MTGVTSTFPPGHTRATVGSGHVTVSKTSLCASLILCKIKPIAFYTADGGLEEIASITGGEYRQVNDIKEFHVDDGGGASDW
jgi:hypothetical protein